MKRVAKDCDTRREAAETYRNNMEICITVTKNLNATEYFSWKSSASCKQNITEISSDTELTGRGD